MIYKAFLALIKPERQTPKSCPVCALHIALRPWDAHSATERPWPSLPPPELPLLHVRLDAFKRIKLWWPQEPVPGLCIPWRLEWSSCSWIPQAGLNWHDIDFAFFLNTRQGDIFNPSPPRAKVITQDAINQVGKLWMAKAREIFFSFEQVLWSCNYLMKSTYFTVDRAKEQQVELHVLGVRVHRVCRYWLCHVVFQVQSFL